MLNCGYPRIAVRIHAKIVKLQSNLLPKNINEILGRDEKHKFLNQKKSKLLSNYTFALF